MVLGEIAHVRTGDKGDIAQFSVIAFDPDNYPIIEHALSADTVRKLFNDLPLTAVKRFTLPQLGALMFVLEGAHGGGVTRSLALDAHGKTLGSRIVDVELPLEAMSAKA
jgi:hypothetical protein